MAAVDTRSTQRQANSEDPVEPSPLFNRRIALAMFAGLAGGQAIRSLSGRSGEPRPSEALELLNDQPSHPLLPLAEVISIDRGSDSVASRDASFSDSRVTVASIRDLNHSFPPVINSVTDLLSGTLPPLETASLGAKSRDWTERQVTFVRINSLDIPVTVNQLETGVAVAGWGTISELSLLIGGREIVSSADHIYLYSNAATSPLCFNISSAFLSDYDRKLETDHPRVSIAIEGELFFGKDYKMFRLPVVPVRLPDSYAKKNPSSQEFEISVRPEVTIRTGASGLAIWFQETFMGYDSDPAPTLLGNGRCVSPFTIPPSSGGAVSADRRLACDLVISLLGPDSPSLHFLKGITVHDARDQFAEWLKVNRAILNCPENEIKAISDAFYQGRNGTADLRNFSKHIY